MAKNQKPRRPSKKQIQALIKKEGKIRTAFILRNKHEMTVKDIAEALEISERTARAYQWRVKEPEKYGVVDKNAWRALYGKGIDEPTPEQYRSYLEDVRKLAKSCKMKVHDVDAALYIIGKRLRTRKYREDVYGL